MSFFARNSSRLVLTEKKSPTALGLRECQIGAYWATRAHFTASKEPALIVMPTGAGKTAVLMMLALGLKAKRVLVVTPAVVLRDQTFNKFTTLDDLVTQGVFPRRVGRPNAYCQENRITSQRAWRELEKYDLVVTTPHTISRVYHKSIVPPPKGLFDLVLFDEAHHIRARSWEELLEKFSDAKCVQLTATPFRLDQRKLPGRIVYSYPIQKAIDGGIYRPVEYHKVEVWSPEARDQALCEKAKAILEEEERNSRRSKILIRTDRVKKSKPLIDLYMSNGIHVDEVSYMKTIKTNERVLSALRKDQLDGVVCVGMLGEGLDIPELKIAVLHDPPKSFPFTIQFVGRVSRPAKGQVGDAHVIADPRQIAAGSVGDEVRHLYYSDEGWHRLVPAMVDEVVGRVVEDLSAPYEYVVGAVNPRDINPFYSVRAYNVQPNNLDMYKKFYLGEDIVVYSVPPINPQLRGFITQRTTPPPWATKLTRLEVVTFDLHLYYYHQRTRVLFESTTSDQLASKIRREIINGQARRLGGGDLVKVMQSDTALTYLIVGLANALGPCPAIPTYKTFMGTEVQGAVVPTDGRVFVPGHALARRSDGETRGIGSFQGRVWSVKRGPLNDFATWCQRIGDELYRYRSATFLREVPFLNNPTLIEKFPDKPIEVIFDPLHVGYYLEISRRERGQAGPIVRVESPEFVIHNMSGDKRYLALTFYPNLEDRSFGVSLRYDVSRDMWQVRDDAHFHLRMDAGDFGLAVASETFDLELAFSEKFVPWIYLVNGGLVRGGQLFAPEPTYSKVPEECFERGLDWSQCDIQKEFAIPPRRVPPATGKLSVQEWLEEWLKQRTTEDSVVLKDHAAGEIADFVVVKPLVGTGSVSFYHCKASPTRTPGASIEHLKEVVDQVLRSVEWIKRKELLKEIQARGTGSRPRPNSAFVKGNGDMLANMIAGFVPSKWSYEVVIVQPGLDSTRATQNKNTNIILLTCYEWLKTIGAELRIMGS